MKGAKLTFLGTGTSQGVPMIGCDCPVCSSEDPRDKRLRSSVLIEYGGLVMAVDAGPDFRTQMLRAGVKHLDAILFTHGHKDHTGGIDDVRSFNYLEKKPVSIYCEKTVENTLRREIAYAFAEPKYPGVPEINLHIFDPSDGPFRVYSNACEDDLCWSGGYSRTPSTVSRDDCPSVEVLPVRFFHDRSRTFGVVGYRFGNIAYVTDIAAFDSSSIDLIKGVDYVTVNCVKRGVHYSHLSLDEVREFFTAVGAKQSYLTHISHQLPAYRDFEEELGQWEIGGRTNCVHVAYDGLVLE